jgi:hypothetical protein
MSDSPDATRSAGGRFAAGNPGGPGRPRGAVSAAAAALDLAAVEAQQELLNVVLDKARAGDLKAIEMLWARVWPLRRGRPVAFAAPAVGGIDDILPAKAAVTEAVLSGEISAHEAQPVLEVIDSHREQIGDDAHRSLFATIGTTVFGAKQDETS